MENNKKLNFESVVNIIIVFMMIILIGETVVIEIGWCDNTPTPTPTSPLSLFISLDKTNYISNEIMTITVELKNISSEDVVLPDWNNNTAAFRVYFDTTITHEEYPVMINDESWVVTWDDPKFWHTDSVFTLEPNQEKIDQYVIHRPENNRGSNCFAWERVESGFIRFERICGEFTLKMTYEVGPEGLPLGELADQVWQGKIESNEVTFTMELAPGVTPPPTIMAPLEPTSTPTPGQ